MKIFIKHYSFKTPFKTTKYKLIIRKSDYDGKTFLKNQ